MHSRHQEPRSGTIDPGFLHEAPTNREVLGQQLRKSEGLGTAELRRATIRETHDA
jgi:hypothetical protein